MTSSLANPEYAAHEYPRNREDRKAIRAQMEKMLASSHFRQSKRYPVLLRYLVEQTLDGRAAELKERTVGVEVFEREPDYDTNLDPVVRVTAGEVRKRIAQYYHDAGHLDEPRIDLPAGSYIPHFRLPSEQHAITSLYGEEALAAPSMVAERALEVLAPERQASPAVHRIEGKLLFASISAVILAVAGWYWMGRQRAAADAVWTPLLNPSPLLISVGEPSLVFNQTAGAKPGPLTVRDHLRGVDYMVFSDVQALTRVTAMLDSHSQPYRLLPASATTYADLRQGPAVLLGGFDNPWTMRATSKLRFQLVRSAGDDELCIEDKKDGGGRRWAVNFSQRYDSLSEDYAIVARFMDPDTHQPVVILAGIGENGTKAASELMTDASSEAFRTLADSLPRDSSRQGWVGRNFEEVVKTQVINGVSGPPLVVAKEIW